MRNARQWGGCWLVCALYEQLKLHRFWAERLPPGRKGTRWDLILQKRYVYIVLSSPAVSGVSIDTGLIATQTGITGAAGAQNHGLRPIVQIGLCSEDF